MSERVVYINGALVPESQATVSVFDRGFTSGDGVYEATRTFGHKLFRLPQHLDRLYASLRYVRIECGVARDEMQRACEELVERNLALLDDDDEYSLWHVITRGARVPGTTTTAGPTVVMFTMPVDFARYARSYIEGVPLVTPATRRTPPQSLDPKAKITNKMNHNMALFEAQQVEPGAVPLMLDLDGNLTETDTTNFFFVRDGRLFTPSARTVLGGITRDAVFELAAGLGIEVVEGAFTPFDVYNADEAFLSGTSGSITPVSRLNGTAPVAGVPGPLTLRLIAAWNEMVGIDYVAQALRHLGHNEASDLLAEWERITRAPARKK